MKPSPIIPVTAIVTLVLDAASKAWAKGALSPAQPVTAIPGLINFTLTTNTGAAFGVGRQSNEGMAVLAFAILAAIIVLSIRRESSQEKPALIERIAYGLLIGGALGNLADRLLFGRVTDFIEFAFISFPVFNVADALIDVGIALFLIHSLTEKPGGKQSKAETPS